MRTNTGRQTITTTNFTGNQWETGAWTAEEVADYGVEFVRDMADAHRLNAADAEYTAEYGLASVVEYELPGLTVIAFLLDGKLFVVFEIADDTASRFHYAARKSFPVTITYTKADGTETVRTIEPVALRLTKAGDTVIKAMDRDSGEARTFRLDRVSRYTLHRTRPTVRTEAPAPSKAELAEAFLAGRRTAPVPASCEHVFHRHHVGQPYRCRRCDAVKLFRTDGVGTVVVSNEAYRRMMSRV